MSTQGYSASSRGSSFLDPSTSRNLSTVSLEISLFFSPVLLSCPRPIAKLPRTSPEKHLPERYSSRHGVEEERNATRLERCSTSFRWSRLALRNCRSTISMYLNASPFSPIRCAPYPFTRNLFHSSPFLHFASPSSNRSASTLDPRRWRSLRASIPRQVLPSARTTVPPRRFTVLERWWVDPKAVLVRPERRWF